MADYKVTDTELTSIANAIRAKTGKSAQIEFPTEFVSEIEGISSGDIPLLSRSAWNSLTTAQKQAYGLVAIQDLNSGFERGKLVYGMDYVDTWIPYSNNVVAEGRMVDTVTGNIWGNNILVEDVTQGADGVLAVNNATYTNDICMSAMLPDTSGSFTAYISANRASGSNNRFLMSFGNEDDSTNAGLGILFDGTNFKLSLWGNDTNFATASGSKKVKNLYIAALVYDSVNGLVYGHVLNSDGSTISSLSKTKLTRNTSRVVVGKSFPTHSNPSYDNRTNINVGFLAVVNGVDSIANITSNLVNIASTMESI